VKVVNSWDFLLCVILYEMFSFYNVNISVIVIAIAPLMKVHKRCCDL